MAKFKTPMMNRRATPNNVTNEVVGLKNARVYEQLEEQAAKEDLNLNLTQQPLVYPEVICPAPTATSNVPTDTGFTGSYVSGSGWTFNSVLYHVASVASGALQAGFNYLGKLIAGGGAVTLDENGIDFVAPSLYSAPNSIKFTKPSASAPMFTIYGLSDTQNVAAIKVGDITSAVPSAMLLVADADTGQAAAIQIQPAIENIDKGGIYLSDTVIYLNQAASDVDTVIRGDTTTIATFDAGLNAMGVGGAAESGKIAKFTGATRTTGASALDGLVTTLAGIDNTNGHVRSFSATINDDTATSFTPTKTSGLVIFGGYDSAAAGTFYGIGFYQATGSPFAQSFTLGSNTVFTTGALAGTTGTDTKFTFSAHTDGKLYFENRRGAARVVYVTLI